MNKNKSKKTDDTEPASEDISSGETVVPSPTTVAKAPSGLLDVDALSKKTGNRLKFNGHNPHNIRGAGPMHRAADTLHGWSDYKHHYAKAVQLSEADYLAALKAAGNYETHPAAMAPHKRK